MAWQGLASGVTYYMIYGSHLFSVSMFGPPHYTAVLMHTVLGGAPLETMEIEKQKYCLRKR